MGNQEKSDERQSKLNTVGDILKMTASIGSKDDHVFDLLHTARSYSSHTEGPQSDIESSTANAT